ncbi:MAG: hypothetical protein PHW75_00390 [Patescibacteria group bacterium]|nr:hypothetical protein [Patescibacteria group bacterium]
MKRKDNIKKKASLSWSLTDYKELCEEPPECLYFGKTEGESLSATEVEAWVQDAAKSLLVISEEYPKKFNEQYEYFLLDLEYLRSLGKITEEEYEELIKRENLTQSGQE